MKKSLLTLLFFSFFFIRSKADTAISGVIGASTTWTVANSPYIITGNTLITAGTTLTIQPGVQVRFNSTTTIQASGNISAIGTAANHILFTANTANPVKGFWNCVDIIGTYNGVENNGPIASFFDYCDFRYGGASTKGLLSVSYATAQITNSTFQQSSTYGLNFIGSPTRVENCNISYNENSGIYHQNDPRNTARIIGNTVSYNGGVGINMPSFGLYDVYLNNNRIVANAGALNLDPSGGGSGSHSLYFQNNKIDSNVASTRPTIYIGQSFSIYMTGDTITNNTATNNNVMIIYYGYNPYVNLFQNNYIANNKANGADLLYFYYIVGYNNTPFNFINNKVLNNTSTGSLLYLYGNNGYLNFNMNVSNNSFTGNTAANTFYLRQFKGNINNNNINNNVTYEINNRNGSSDPMVDAKSNYWGRSRAGIDNVVYDFFDNGAYSVVLLDPVLEAPLPLTLLSFTAMRQGITGVVQWQTTKELNVDYFELEKSMDGVTYAVVATYNATNNPSAVNNYQYADKQLGANNYYRLRTHDKDGKTTLSAVASIKSATATTAIAITPNPGTQATTQVILQGFNPGEAITLTILNAAGRVVAKTKVTATTAQTIVRLSTVAALTQGYYSITASSITQTASANLILTR